MLNANIMVASTAESSKQSRKKSKGQTANEAPQCSWARACASCSTRRRTFRHGEYRKKENPDPDRLVDARRSTASAGRRPRGEDEFEKAASPTGTGKRKGADVDPTIVSEALWVEWRASVKEFGFGQETLGRYVSSLQQLPRVIWNAPLESYLELSLAEIRALRTHGEKRVGAVLEVFGNLHKIVVHLGAQHQLGVRVLPRFVIHLEGWVLRYLQRSGAPSYQELRSEFVAPLLEQVRIDAGSQIAKLAESQLSPSGATVRQAAHKLGLTRARIYQLLGDMAMIVKVRWPEGQALVAKLRDRLASQDAAPATLELLDAAIELFFVNGANDLPTPLQPAANEPTQFEEAAKANGHAGNGHKQNGHARDANGHREAARRAASGNLALRRAAAKGRAGAGERFHP
jgi:hypothetical protein